MRLLKSVDKESIMEKLKEYSTPKLTVHGSVATLTQQDQGGSGCMPSMKECGGGDGNSRLFNPLLS